VNILIRLACIVLLGASTAAVADSPDPLDAIDCAALRVDFVSLLPDMIRPQRFAIPAAPFDQTALARIEKAAEQDPNGLCHYRDANHALPKATSNRVVFYGDSITEYWALAAPGLFKGDVIDRGVSAQNTTQMLARFRHDVIDLKPRVVHIMAGINDSMSAGGMLSTRSNIMAMVELARAHKVTVILGSLTPSTEFWLAPGIELAPGIATHNAWLKRYAARERIAFVDYHTPLVGEAGAFRADLSNEGLHPNRLGYAVMTPLARSVIRAAHRVYDAK
jgi:lysophospholipase L1-like esterase